MSPRVAALSLLVLASCIPTLSAEHGAVYLAAMARADHARTTGHLREAAAAWLDAAAHAERPKDRAEATVRAARVTAALGDVDAALALYARVYDLRPPTQQAGGALVEAARLLPDGADLDLRAIREHPDDAAASRALADLVSRQPARSAREGETEGEREAEDSDLSLLDSLYREVGGHDVGDDLLVAIADAALAAGDHARARAALQRCLREHPYPRGSRVDDVSMRLAALDEQDGDPHAAAADLESLALLHEHASLFGSSGLPQMPAAELRLARLYRDALADPARASATFARLRASYPTSVFVDDSLYEEGAMWIAHGDAPRGCALLESAIASNGGHATRLARTAAQASCAR